MQQASKTKADRPLRRKVHGQRHGHAEARQSRATDTDARR